MSTPALPHSQQRRLRDHFGFARLPFRKNVPAHQMFDSESQRALLHGLRLWLDLRGLALVTGSSGVGKSICLRRFVNDLPQGRYAVHVFGQIPTTPIGFLRALTRRLGLRPRLHLSDMFDDVCEALARHEEEHGTHPVLVLDDAEGMRPATLDLVRRLTSNSLDGEDHVSVLLAGTEQFLTVLRDPRLVPLQTRFGYACSLLQFGIHAAGTGQPAVLLQFVFAVPQRTHSQDHRLGIRAGQPAPIQQHAGKREPAPEQQRMPGQHVEQLELRRPDAARTQAADQPVDRPDVARPAGDRHPGRFDVAHQGSLAQLRPATARC